MLILVDGLRRWQPLEHVSWKRLLETLEKLGKGLGRDKSR